MKLFSLSLIVDRNAAVGQNVTFMQYLEFLRATAYNCYIAYATAIPSVRLFVFHARGLHQNG